jgi:hypothetical protein
VLAAVLRDEVPRGRVVYGASSRRFILNGGLPEAVRQAFREPVGVALGREAPRSRRPPLALVLSHADGVGGGTNLLRSALPANASASTASRSVRSSEAGTLGKSIGPALLFQLSQV